MTKFIKASVSLILCILITQINGQQFQKDRVCSSSRHIEECNQLQRGNSEVNCIWVQDAVECAQRIRNGTAEFGVFSAENALHIAAMGWEGLTVIKEVRHDERIREAFDFQSVVIIRKEHTGGVRNLAGMDFCHPGLHYERHQKWSERFLKHFERTIVPTNCSSDGTSPAEIEASAMDRFFNAACRPGAWSNNIKEDEQLKARFPRLCALCDNALNCTYEESSASSSHRQALECVRKSGNALTYVALQEAKDFFNSNSDISNQFSYLCPNGTYQSITNNSKPCVWLSQPWKLIISNDEKAITLAQLLNRWMTSTGSWESALRQILTADSHSISSVNSISRLADYVTPIRAVPISTEMCQTTSTWCTHSFDEKDKCDVLRIAALTSGVLPVLNCGNPKSDVITCISDVSMGKADFVGIDSNFGFLARHPYNLTAALYEETETEKYSSVVAVIKEKDAERITRFEDFKGKQACFPEFGGIASIAFINVAKNRGIFKREECEFGKLLGNYFNESCLPGSRNIFHDPTATNPDNLCSLCQVHAVLTTTVIPLKPLADQIDDEERAYDDTPADDDGIEGDEQDEEIVPIVPNRATDCAASASNRFYGSRGALACLNEVGDVAVVEHQNLVAHAQALKLNPSDFRILCRNGSLASYPGFDVDPACFLTTIVDGEIVVRRNSSKTPGIINALSSLDKYLQNDPDFKMYNIFSGERDLLFEDSSLGLVSNNDASLSQSVQNYIKLFEDVENCIEETGGATEITINILLTFSLVLFTTLITN